MPTSPSLSSPVKIPPPAGKVTDQKSVSALPPKPSVRRKPVLGYRQKIFTWAAVGSLLGLVLISGNLIVASRLHRRAAELTQKRSALEAYSRQEESYQQLLQSLELVEKDVLLINQSLLSETEVNRLLDEISKLKEKHGLTGRLAFSNDQPRLDRQGNPFIELVFEATGETGKIYSFLNDFLFQPRLMKVVLLDINQLDRKEPRLIFKVRFYTDPEFSS